jgi:serine/threonine protein phosphatase PrpC
VILAMPLGVWVNLAAKMLTLGIGAGETSGTTATLVVVDGLTVTVASVGDSRCIVDTNGGEVSLLTVDHRLEENAEERERVTASGGEVSRLNLCGGQEVMLYLEIGMKREEFRAASACCGSTSGCELCCQLLLCFS